MFKMLYILFFAICSLLFGQQVDFASEHTSSSEQSLTSRYTTQLECAHRHNNYAEQCTSISVPAGSVSTLGTRGQQQKATNATAIVATATAGAIFSVQHTLYRIYGKRAIDYYLYTLCCLRL